ncbi:hypothetical protein CEP54_014711 [Fusarium duplospermum]|uniref:Uncharacterized protein n=1 Tax=Fusarium duplospermum TaxID=1325734 RepID=A0A428NU84_9HYPO|nr:hypothetical protein CEP54_014711 [Fusarium duplospermum]
MVPFTSMTDISNLVLLPEDIDIREDQKNHPGDIGLGTQLTLFPFPSFSLLSALSSISFTLPMDPAPSIGTSDSQAVAFHRIVLAPMKSTQVAAVSWHTLFLDFAIQNRMALHLLLAFSHSELAIHQGYSDRPPLESYLHFQHGSQLFTQQLESFMAVAPAFPLMMSLSASNIAGFTKKSTVMAMIFLGYCAGNLSGPQFFISTEAPSYHTAYTTILACFAITIVLVVAMRFYLA